MFEKTTIKFDVYTVNIATGTPVADDVNFDFVVHATNATLPQSFTQEEINAAIKNPGVSAWGYIDTDGTVLGGMNVGSVDTSGGAYVHVITWTTPMPDANYSIVGTLDRDDNVTVRFQDKTATGVTVVLKDDGNNPSTGPYSFQVVATNALPLSGGTGADAWAAVNTDGSVDASSNCTVSRTQGPDGTTYPLSTGFYYVTFNTPMPSANYSVSSSIAEDTFGVTPNIYNKSSEGFWVDVRGQGGTRYDQAFDFVVHATNAVLPETVTQEQIESAIEVSDMFSVAGDFINSENNKGLNIQTTGLNQGIYASATGTNAAYGLSGYVANGTASQYGVYGQAETSSTYSSGGGLFYSINNNTYGIIGYWSGGGYYSFYGNGAVGGTSFPNTSDARLKDVVSSIDSGCLQKICNLQAVKYTWRSGTEAERSHGSDVQIGFLAQDVQTEFPELVTSVQRNQITGANQQSVDELIGTTLAIDYGRMTAVLAQALKEACVRIEDLEAKVEIIENRSLLDESYATVADLPLAVDHKGRQTYVDAENALYFSSGTDWIKLQSA